LNKRSLPHWLDASLLGCVQAERPPEPAREDKATDLKPWEDKMNITINTTQWGDANQPIIRTTAERHPMSIIRNMVMTITILSIAGLMVIQILSPSPENVQAVVNDPVERSAEVVSGEDLLSAEVMSTENILRTELNKEISLVNLDRFGVLSK
jgi:hypothetical protein